MAGGTPIFISPEIQDVLERLAAEDNCVPEDVLKTAVQTYDNSRRLEEIATWGFNHAREHGFTEADVQPAIDAVRSERAKNAE